MAVGLGDREAADAREISKMFEECVTGTLTDLAAPYADAPPTGEIVVIVGPHGEEAVEADDDANLTAALREATAESTLPQADKRRQVELGVRRKRVRTHTTQG